MRTEVRIIIDHDDVPGGIQTILRPTGCGHDVATFNEVAESTTITIDETDPRLLILLNLLKERGISWWEVRRDRFTDAEIDAATLLVVAMSDRNDAIFGGPRMGTTYDMSAACPRCGAGARQTSAMIIDAEYLHLFEGRRAASTCYSDILVDKNVAAALALSGATGLSFRGVFAAFENKVRFQLPWEQICPTHTLPPMSPRSTGIKPYEPCPCKRSGYSTYRNIPPRLTYRAADLVGIKDVNLTWEWFGDYKYNGVVGEALFPYPWFLITPKVWRVFRDAGVTGFDFIPVRVVND
jgi:hypothetical protein